MKDRRKLDSSYRVMKTLHLLHRNPMSMEQLIYELDVEEQGVNKETISKYFATLRHFGCIIEKSNRKFELKYLPFFINLSDKELETLAIFEKFSEKLCHGSDGEKIRNIFKMILKMEKHSGREKYEKILQGIRIKDIYSRYTEKMDTLSKFFNDSVRIMYKKVWVNISPKNFKYSRRRVYLYAYDENKRENRLFLLDDIKDAAHVPKRPSTEFFTGKTIFKIKDRLAKGYYLYDEEKVLEDKKNYKIISNKAQDKQELKKRLLKYAEFAEIISPGVEREKFVKTIDVMIKNHSQSHS